MCFTKNIKGKVGKRDPRADLRVPAAWAQSTVHEKSQCVRSLARYSDRWHGHTRFREQNAMECCKLMQSKVSSAELTRCSKGTTKDSGATSIKPVPARGQWPIGKSSLRMRTPQRRWPEASYLTGRRLTGAGLEEGTDTGHHQLTEVRRPGRAYVFLTYPKEHSKRNRYSSAVPFLEEAHSAIPALF